MNAKATLLIATLLVTAGCMNFGGGSGTSEGEYEGRYRIFDLYLFPLGTSGGQDTRWELYPDAKVEAWAFSFENDPRTATIPGPTIRVREGDTVEINFIIRGAPMAHTLHWHGLHVPWDQDGVPYLSQAPIGNRMGGGNGSFSYSYIFTVEQSGTYWYHCHVDTQHHMDMGMYGAFIVDPADPGQDPPYDQEATLTFDEWDKSHIHSNLQPDQLAARSGDPEETVSALYGQLRDYYHQNQLVRPEQLYQQALDDPNLPEAFKDVIRENPPPGVRENRDWYPVTYAPYYAEYDTFLINGRAFPSTEPILVDPDTVLRMRLINAGSLAHSIHLHGHHMYVTHKDGYRVPTLAASGKAGSVDTHEEFQRYTQPVDTVLIAPGERYDLYVVLDNPGPWMLHDHMPQYEQNDHISPGGMMTHMCYREGWEFASVCDEEHFEGTVDGMTGGLLIEQMTAYFHAAQGAYVDPAYEGAPGHNH